MPGENYRRIWKGYEPEEPTTIGEKLFYIIWWNLQGLRFMAKIIQWRVSEKMKGKNK